MRPLLHHLLLSAAIVVLSAGCTTTTPGQASPTPGDGPDTSSDTTTQSNPSDSGKLPTDGAPAVENPLETAMFQENPCLSLTPEQSEDIFNLSPAGRPFRGALGNACEWKNESTWGQAEVRFLIENTRGLSAEYAVNNEGDWAYFEPLSVEGHPAVARSQADTRADGECAVVVGATDEVTFEVRVQQSRDNIGKGDPCVTAADIAGEAVKTMEAG